MLGSLTGRIVMVGDPDWPDLDAASRAALALADPARGHHRSTLLHRPVVRVGRNQTVESVYVRAWNVAAARTRAVTAPHLELLNPADPGDVPDLLVAFATSLRGYAAKCVALAHVLGWPPCELHAAPGVCWDDLDLTEAEKLATNTAARWAG